MKTYVGIKSESLTTIAKQIFGDIVEDAYMDESAGNYERDLLGVHDKSFDLSPNPLLIKFTNGKVVCFTCSEWGDIESAEITQEAV